MTESVKSESASADSDDETRASRQSLSTDVTGATAVPGVKPIFIIPGSTLPSGICTPAVFLVNMIDGGKFRSPMMQVGGVGMPGAQQYTYLSLPASDGLSTGAYQLPSSNSYATLTPLQPLPPISTVSDRLGQSLPFGSGFAFIQNNGANNAINVQNSFKYENKLSVTTAVNNISGTPLLVGPSGYPQNGAPYSFAFYDPSLLQQFSKSEDKTTVLLADNVASNSGLVPGASQLDRDAASFAANSPPSCVSDINLADSTTPSNRQVDLPPDVEINTRDLAQKIANELKRYGIPQAVFAQKILGRSQGTLSDLLRNPKPWSKLKSGRETFARMWKWLQEPEADRLATLKLLGSTLESGNNTPPKPPSTGGVKRKELHIAPVVAGVDSPLIVPQGGSPGTEGEVGGVKKPRLVFTDIQRRTLMAIFKETKRPSKDMQVTIAEQLGLKASTVANFFMNARRRSTDKYRDDSITSPAVCDTLATPTDMLYAPLTVTQTAEESTDNT